MDRESLTGRVTSRKCPRCGHHEIGLTTENGTFHSLEPGTRIKILPPPGPEEDLKKALTSAQDRTLYRPWVPEPLKGNSAMRLKYGVFINKETSAISGKVYGQAYLLKVVHLLENHLHTPLAVILDRYFSAPHLASGNPEQIALAMWKELEEVRKPVDLVKAWLENPTREALIRLISPRSEQDLNKAFPSREEEFTRELERLSLEEFLDLV